MASKLSNVGSFRTVLWSCALLAAAAALGGTVALVDTRVVTICLIALTIAITSFILYFRYVGRELPVIAMLGSGLVALASATVTFNGIRLLRNATLSDFLLVAGAVVLIAALLTERYTWPTYPLVGAIGALLLGISVAASTAISRTPDQDLLAGIFFLVGTLLTPLVVAAAARSPAALEVVTFLWVASGAVNGAVSALDSFGITTLGPSLTGITFFGRQAGLTVHPNHLGLACVMVVPVALALVLSGRRFAFRIVVAALTALAIVGVLVSGSRGATLGIVVGPAVSAFLMFRRRLSAVAVAAVLIAATVSIGAFASQDLISVARLTGQVAVQGADVQRTAALTQSLNDVLASPVIGNGYGYGRDAHDIYLQAAAAGGALALAGLLLLLGAIVQSGVRCTLRADLPLRLRVLAAGLVGSMATWLAVGIVENPIYDRYLYWPAGLLLAIRFLSSTLGQRTRVTTDAASEPETVVARKGAGSQDPTENLGSRA